MIQDDNSVTVLAQSSSDASQGTDEQQQDQQANQIDSSVTQINESNSDAAPADQQVGLAQVDTDE